MADINIANLPDASLPVDGADLLHLSQSSVDKKVTIDDMSAEFGKAEIASLTEDSTPLSSYFLVEAIDSNIDNNKKVSLANVGLLFQTDGFYTDKVAIDITDNIIFRDDTDTTLSEVPLSYVRATVNDFSILTPETILATGDLFNFYDVSVSDNKRITTANLRSEMFDVGALSTIGTIDTSDYMYISDSGTLKKVDISTLDSRWEFSGVSGDVFLANTQTFTGTNSFSASAGIIVNKITAYSGSTVEVGSTNLNGTAATFTSTVSANKYIGGGFFGVLNNTANINSYLWGGGVQAFTLVGTQTALIPATINSAGGVQATDAWLGDASRQWTDGYIQNINVDTSAALPTATTINSVDLMDGGKINSGLIPDASTSSVGGFLLASALQLEDGIGANAGITAALLGGLLEKDSHTKTILSRTYNIKARSFKIGGLVINFGRYVDSSPKSGGREVSVDLSLGGFRQFSNANYTVVATPLNDGHGGATRFQEIYNSSRTSGGFSIALSSDGSPSNGMQFIAIGEG
ncbi:MAG: hypothetical protein GY714_01570 [Desulfobacterales bacterium]|nr:hypothetical protein [Desulfobacterales bacterium]